MKPSKSFNNLNLLFVFAFLGGCAKPSLDELDPLADIQGTLAARHVTASVDVCTLPAVKTRSRLKYIFIVDRSGSNVRDDFEEPGTDPSGELRFAELANFLDKETTKEPLANATATDPDPNTSYNLVLFSTGAGATGFYNDPAQFKSIIQDQLDQRDCTSSPPAKIPHPRCNVNADDGFTNYQQAFAVASAQIQADLDVARQQPEIVSTYYVVVFITDGAPVIGYEEYVDTSVEPPVLKTRKIYQDQSFPGAIEGAVGGMKGLGDSETYKAYVDDIQVYTGLYYNNSSITDADKNRAIALLNKIASVGEVRAPVDEPALFPAGSKIDYSRYVVPEKQIRKGLQNVIAVNESVGWYQRGLYVSSSDDGVTDVEKGARGMRLATIQDPDSDGNQLSDRVEMFLFRSACGHPGCHPTAPQTRSTLSCDQQVRDPVTGIYPDLDKDGLNSCEEQLLQTSATDFDTNDNLVPDNLEVQYPISPKYDYLGEIPFAGEGTRFQKLMAGIPVDLPARGIPGLAEQRYEWNFISSDETQDCWNIRISNIYSLSGSDTIALYVMESSRAIENKKYLRQARKNTNGSSTIYFDSEDLQ